MSQPKPTPPLMDAQSPSSALFPLSPQQVRLFALGEEAPDMGFSSTQAERLATTLLQNSVKN